MYGSKYEVHTKRERNGISKRYRERHLRRERISVSATRRHRSGGVWERPRRRDRYNPTADLVRVGGDRWRGWGGPLPSAAPRSPSAVGAYIRIRRVVFVYDFVGRKWRELEGNAGRGFGGKETEGKMAKEGFTVELLRSDVWVGFSSHILSRWHVSRPNGDLMPFEW